MKENKKVKIGVITFQRALNYGALLQAYALQQFLTKEGYDPNLIDYYPTTFKNERKLINFSSLGQLTKSLIKFPMYKKKVDAFNRFLKKCNITKIYRSSIELEKLNKEYDLFISGSDQVWNSKWNFNDPNYFLSFADVDKRYSYAASIGNNMMSDIQEEIIKEKLNSFSKISLREESTSKWLKDILPNNDIETNIDPTLLLSKDEWLKITLKNKEKPYLLIYMLENNGDLLDFAKKEAKRRNINIIQIKDVFKNEDPEIKFASCISIERFVTLFANADFIVTNSFHGLAFSTIMEKDFVLAMQKAHNAPNERLSSFIEKFSLQNHLLDSYEPSLNDYELVKSVINKEKDTSSIYIKAITSQNQKVYPTSESKCAGCTACYEVCPKSAIKIRDGKLGFSYPVIDLDKCIHCGLCDKVCMYVNKENKIDNKLIRSLVVKNTDESQRINSRSGGVFPLLAERILKENGVIYGANLDENNLSISHIKIDNISEIYKLTKSKYVESKLKDTFHNVASDLKNGLNVLFSGTPCQNAGLKYLLKTLKIDDTNLLCVDIVCHGYMSPEIYQSYITKQDKKYKEITSFEFRDKSFGWNTHVESFISEGKKITSTEYTNMFYTNDFLRPSCYNCLYTNLNRPGDITLADAWGAKNIFPEFDDNKGVSLILINSKKGEEAFNNIKSKTTYKSIDINKVMQTNLYEPTTKSKKHKKLEKIYSINGYQGLSFSASKETRKVSLKNRFKSSILKVLRKLHLK
jgi:coenzyme F420-reducing hydrogenase beta subunit